MIALVVAFLIGVVGVIAGVVGMILWAWWN
jgi:hypothetical protein